jgi:DNA polymerase I-like protein with 3'-5' exonuclease and polymerase domains
MMALDCETTGVDLHHTARPFLVTICRDDGKFEPEYFEWDVDPRTREPSIPQEDKDAIVKMIEEEDFLIMHNGKFDVKALNTIIPGLGDNWPWHKTYDTLRASHLLSSNTSHVLTDLGIQYLNTNIQPFENKLEIAVKEARKIVKRQFPSWKTASNKLPEMPSAKEETWRFDYFLPRTLARELKLPTDHPWWNVCAEYANTDSATTLALWKVMEEQLKERGLWKIFLEMMKVYPIALDMEDKGVSVNGNNMEELQTRFLPERDVRAQKCIDIALAHYGYDLELPKGAAPNNSIREFIFGVMKLPVVALSDKGNPSLDKEVMKQYELTLDGTPLQFISTLLSKRKYDTALSYMESYRRFWLPSKAKGYWLLHPNLNPTGTNTLRWSCNNPNEQNISKQGDANIRYAFGPRPGREWWSFDGKNLELRIPAWEAEEEEMIQLFLKMNEPPYYGSYHLFIFDTLYPKLFEKHGKDVKDLFEDTYYQWTKNFNFAKQYQCGEKKADATARVEGASRMVDGRLPKIAKLNRYWVSFANKHGYVETKPDKTIDPTRGYPLYCSRGDKGNISPTIPFSYHIQGTACHWINRTMVKVHGQLQDWTKSDPRGYYITMQVHDELVLDFPKGVGAEPWKTNLPKARKVQKLMEQCGTDIGVVTPTSCGYHDNNWGKEKSL